MPIKIFSDRIELGDKVITATPTGIRIDDSLSANTQNTRLGSTNFTARQLAYGSFVFQGSVAGYHIGGGSPAYPNFSSNQIVKFPLTSDTSATLVATLTQAVWGVAGLSSSVSGYRAGGNVSGTSPNFTNTIDKFPFASNTNATDVGDMVNAYRNVQGVSSTLNGYIVSTIKTPPNVRDGIEKFPFATDTNSTSIAFLSSGLYSRSTQCSKTHGYTAGGSSPDSAVMNKFPFAADTNATNIGNLTVARAGPTGQSSTTHGYASGGLVGSTSVNTIDKFPFATDTNATDVGDLTQIRNLAASQSSTTHGYTSGGDSSGTPAGYVNTIDKFPFAADGNATDVGDLPTINGVLPAGAQF